jgi:hypothetical protein
MTDVSPQRTDPDRTEQAPQPDPIRLAAAGTELQQAIDDLTRSITSGGAFGKENARDRFEAALAEYAALIDATAT